MAAALPCRLLPCFTAAGANVGLNLAPLCPVPSAQSNSNARNTVKNVNQAMRDWHGAFEIVASSRCVLSSAFGTDYSARRHKFLQEVTVVQVHCK